MEYTTCSVRKTTQDISRFLYPTLVTFVVACTCHDWGVVVVMASRGGASSYLFRNSLPLYY